MKRKSRLIAFIIIIMLSSTITGCFSYADINKVTFPTSILFDKDDLGRIVVYLDCIKPYRSTNDSSDKGRRVVYKGEGKTPYETLSSINAVSSNKLDYSQVKAYIFTENAARDGIGAFLDLINNSYEFPITPKAFVYYGDVEELIETVSNEEEYLGIYLQDLASRYRGDARTIKSNVNDYLNNTLVGNDTLMLASIGLKEDPIDKKIELTGGSVFNKNKLVEQMKPEYSLTYNLLMESVNTGTLEMPNPNEEEGFITLQIVYSSVKTDLVYEDNKYKLVKDIGMEVSLSEAQGQLIIDREMLNYIQAYKEEYINQFAETIFNEYKEYDLDIFDIKKLTEQKYPKHEIENPLENTEIEVNTKIVLRGVGITRNSL